MLLPRPCEPRISINALPFMVDDMATMSPRADTYVRSDTRGIVELLPG